MPVKHFTSVFGVTDCKIARMTADPEGGTATYAASIDVPGIKSVKITGTYETKMLRGDNRLLDRRTTLQDVKVAVGMAKMSLDALQVLIGGTVVDSGVTPNMVATFGLDADSLGSYFRLQAVSLGSDLVGANLQFTLPKLLIDGFPDLGLAEEDYQMASFEAGAVPTLAIPSRWLTIAHNETAVALA